MADAEGTFNRSLELLGLDYVDLYLLHVPYFSEATHGATPAGVWAQLEALHASGRARAIGVSNFSRAQLQRLALTAKVLPAVNQIELNPYLYSRALHEYADAHGILLSAYAPLAPITHWPGGPLDPVLERAAERHGRSREQVLLRWGVQKGWVVVTTSSKVERLREVGRLGEWQLSADEMAEIESVGAQWQRRRFWNKEYAEYEPQN